MSTRAARRRAAKASRRALTPTGATALDAIRVNGREAFFAKAFALMESNDPRERAVAEFMLRGAWASLHAGRERARGLIPGRARGPRGVGGYNLTGEIRKK